MAFRGSGRLDAGGAALAGLAPTVAETGQAVDEVSTLRTGKLTVGALAMVGGPLLLLAVPIGLAVTSAVLTSPSRPFTVEQILALIFSTTWAIPFCFLTIILAAVGIWGLYVGYKHATGDVPFGGTLLGIGIAGIVLSAILLILVGVFVAAIGVGGSVLLLVGGALDLRAG